MISIFFTVNKLIFTKDPLFYFSSLYRIMSESIIGHVKTSYDHFLTMETSQDKVITLETSQEAKTLEGENNKGWQEGDWDHPGDLDSYNVLLSASTLNHAIDQPEDTLPVYGPLNFCSNHTLSQEQEIDDQEAKSPESSWEIESHRLSATLRRAL